jgi:signal transduction histidine kinase
LDTAHLMRMAGHFARRLRACAKQEGIPLVSVPEKLELPLNHRRMERVFLNLVGNALEAMPQGGTISVSATVEPGSVLVQVRDTGPGIARKASGHSACFSFPLPLEGAGAQARRAAEPASNVH